MTEAYKIVNLHAENIKKLKAVDITPDPENNMVTITGKNGAGKTSVLDSILWAIGGKNAIQDKPIRTGETKGLITLDLGDLKIKRSFTEKGAYISVEDAKGFKSTSPQDMLDKLMGAISFDPLAFTRMDKKAQYEALRGLVDIGIDLDAMAEAQKKDFDERTVVNRMVKELESQVASISVPEDTPDEPVNVTELAEKLGHVEQVTATVNNSAENIRKVQAEIKELETRLNNAKIREAELHENRKQAIEQATQLGDIEDIRKQISEAEETNRHVQDARMLRQKEVELKEKKLESTELTSRMEERERAKTDAVAEAKMPIDGLAFEDGAVTYNGVPLDQASTAEQIRVSTAIAMEMNPKLKVIRIKDGSLLDDDSMAALRHMAEEHDFQIWIEVVDSDDPVAIVIEDGEVAGAEQPQEEAA